MCDPFTILATAISAGGAIMQGQAQSAQYEAQAAQYDAQAKLQQRQAMIEQITGQYEAKRKQEQVSRVIAGQRNRYAGSGVLIDGSPTDVMIDASREGALDVAAIQWGQTLKAENLQYQSSISTMNAGIARDAASTAQTVGLINAGSSLLTPFTSGTTGAANRTKFGNLFGM